MTTAIYVAIIEGSQDEGYSAFFPDLPGCVTAAETMFELPAEARDALSLHLAGMIEDGEALPEPTPIEAVTSDPEVKEAGRILVDVEIEDAPVRVNISLGAQFLKRIDVAAETRGMTRSGFLVEAAREYMAPRVAGNAPVRWIQEVGLDAALAEPGMCSLSGVLVADHGQLTDCVWASDPGAGGVVYEAKRSRAETVFGLLRNRETGHFYGGGGHPVELKTLKAFAAGKPAGGPMIIASVPDGHRKR